MNILPSQDTAAKAFLGQLSVVHQRADLTVQQEPVEKSLKDYSRMMIPDVPGRRQDPASWVVDRNEYVKHFRGTTYVAVGAIAKKVAMQEAQVFAVRKRKSGIEHLEVPPTHPLVELLESVNPLHTQFDLWWHMIAWRLMTGDSFWWKAFNGLDVPTELWPIPSQFVWAVPSAQEFIKEYIVRSFFGKRETKLAKDEIIHIQEPGVDWSGNGRFYGTPAIHAAAQAIDLEESILNRLFHNFKNFVPPGMIYTTDEELTIDQISDMYQTIMAQRTAAENSGGPIISHKGLRPAEFSTKTRELDYSRSLEIIMDFILAVMQTPKAVLGLVKDANRANMEASLMTWCEQTINPLLVHCGQHLTRGLAHHYDDDLAIRFEPCTVDDIEAFRKAIETALKNGAVTPNEVRDHLLNMGPYNTGGDRPVIQGSLAEAMFGNVDQSEIEAQRQAERNQQEQEQAGRESGGNRRGNDARAEDTEEDEVDKAINRILRINDAGKVEAISPRIENRLYGHSNGKPRPANNGASR